MAQTAINWDDPTRPLDVEEDINWEETPGQVVPDKIERQPLPKYVGIEDIPNTDEIGTEEEEQTLPPEKFDQLEEPKDYPVFSSIFQALRWARTNGEVIRIKYRCQSGREIIRDIEPHGDFWARTTSKRILVTFDETIGAIRGFIENNILQYKFTGDKFVPRFSFSRSRKNYKARMRHRRQKAKGFL